MKLKLLLALWLAAGLGSAWGTSARAIPGVRSDAAAEPGNANVARLPFTLQSARPIPFRGTLDKIDLEAGTIQVGKRIFYITPETKLLMGDEPVKLTEVKVGLKLGGAYVKSDDDKLIAVSVRFRSIKPPPESEEPEEPGLPKGAGALLEFMR